MALLSRGIEEIKVKFASLQTAKDIADLLDVKYASLIYYIRVLPEKERYASFNIPKKSGGEREIYAPISPIKFIQKKLNFILQNIFKPLYSVHGFIINKNIVTNAQNHTKQRYVLNVDLKDFFPSINFGRVRGMFMTYPFHFNNDIATFLAQICCYQNKLPQGAPTSPIVSNFICAKLDRQLLNLAKQNTCRYTRYADDLTFSTYLPEFPSVIAITNPEISQYSVSIGEKFQEIITRNGFEINDKKIRLRHFSQRQEVTGLTTNRFPNVNRKFIRQVRAMLYDWQKFGLEAAENKHFSKYNKKRPKPEHPRASFREIVKGKINFIGMVRGKDDKIYRNFCVKLKELNPKVKMKMKLSENEKVPLIITEGTSDWKHLKAAFRNLKRQGYFKKTRLRFSEYKGTMGDSPLRSITQLKQTEISLKITIFVFDSDTGEKVKQQLMDRENPRYWGNNVYSFCLPVPEHRPTEKGACIELYYTDDEIKTKDSQGKRLFLSNEFDVTTGVHKEGLCRIKNKGQIKAQLSIFDSYNIEDGSKIALTKNQFAENILEEVDSFRTFNFSKYIKIFETIEKIIKIAEENL